MKPPAQHASGTEADRGRPPTITEVAALAGVSRATVSRAFGRPEMLAAQTVLRVQEAARSLGYVPNRTARALSTGRSGNIAVVVPDIANPFFPPIIRSAQARADGAGLSVFLGDSAESAKRETRLVDRLAVQVDGFVLVASRLAESRIRDLADTSPLVLINRDIAGIPRVLIDTSPGMSAAVEHLAGLGHRMIAYVGGPAASWADRQRRRAAREATARLGLRLAITGAHGATYEAGAGVAADVLESGATAAICFDDVVAHGLLGGLHDRGIRVPDRFSVIGCDDVLAALTYPPLTTITAQVVEAGRIAVETLVSLIEEDSRRDVRQVLPSALVVRSTTAPPPD